MVDTLPAPDTRQNLGCLVKAVRWMQDRNWPADDFFRSIAEEPLRSVVPSNDDPVEILTYDHVISRVDDHRKPGPLFLVALALADVDKGDHGTGDDVVHRPVRPNPH